MILKFSDIKSYPCCGKNVAAPYIEDYPICLAAAFDKRRNIEIDLIGIMDSVYSAILCADTVNDIMKSASSDVKVIFRPYGSLLFDLDTVNDENASDNVLRQYLTDKAEYIHNYGGYDHDTASRLINTLTEPYETNKADLLVAGFNHYRKDYWKIYRYAFAENVPFTDNTLYCTTIMGDAGFIVVSYDLSPIFKSYIMDCGRNHKFLKRCKLCGSMMLGSLANIEELCSAECRKEAHDAAIDCFKEKHCDEHKKKYRSAYLRLLNIKHRLIEKGFSDEEIFSYVNQFKIFQKEAMKQKKELSIKNFDKWLKQQEKILREIADDIQDTAKAASDEAVMHNFKKQEYPEKYIRYIEKHNNQYQAQYLRVYQKWYSRIRRARIKDQFAEEDLKICDDFFSAFAKKSYDMRNDAQSGKISPAEFTRWLDDFDNQLNEIFYRITSERKRSDQQ